MRVDKVSYAGNPEQVTREPFDCIWVRLAERREPSPLRAHVIQWVDWRMLGQLSRHLIGAGRGAKSRPTYFATMKRLMSPMVALASAGATEWQDFKSTCEGLGARKVLVLCEQSDDVAQVEKDVRRCGVSLERVVVGSDGPAGRE